MAVISREALQAAAEPATRPTRAISVPEIGDGVEIVVRGYTVSEEAAILQASITYGPGGEQIHDAQQDKLLSMFYAIVEPELTLQDTAWLKSLPAGVGNRIVAAAMELSHTTQTAYDGLKDSLRRNALVRRIYSVCVNKLGRLPSELEHVSEAEFMAALAALELDAEDIEREAQEQQ
jgi:hypothetical protein